MTEKLTLKAEVRDLSGSANARRYRKAGLIPAVVYNDKTETTLVLVDAKEAKEVVGHHGVFSLVIGGKETQVIIKDVQYNYIAGTIIHIDFIEIDATHKVTASIPVEAVGTPAGASRGGQLEQGLHDIEIKCLPADLPEIIKIDVSELELDKSILVGDVVVADGIEITSASGLAVFTVHAPKGGEEDETEEEGAE